MLQTSWTLAKCLFGSHSLTRLFALFCRVWIRFFFSPFLYFVNYLAHPIHGCPFLFPSPFLQSLLFPFFRFFVSKSAATLKILISILFLNISSTMEFIFYLTFPGVVHRLGSCNRQKAGVCVYWCNMYTQTDWIWNFALCLFSALFVIHHCVVRTTIHFFTNAIFNHCIRQKGENEVTTNIECRTVECFSVAAADDDDMNSWYSRYSTMYTHWVILHAMWKMRERERDGNGEWNGMKGKYKYFDIHSVSWHSLSVSQSSVLLDFVLYVC